MSTTAPRIVLDTNIFIAIISKRSPFRWIFDKIIVGELILCVSHEIVYEYIEVLSDKASPEVADNIQRFLTTHPFIEEIEVYYRFSLIDVDEDDNKFVDCAVASNADYLVTNDGHFDKVKEIDFPRVAVRSLEEFALIR